MMSITEIEQEVKRYTEEYEDLLNGDNAELELLGVCALLVLICDVSNLLCSSKEQW